MSLLLILLCHSFLSFHFCILVSLPVFFFVFAFHVFLFLLFVLSSSCFFLLLCFSVTHLYLVLMCLFVLCFLFVSRLNVFVLCFFFSLFLLFLIFWFFFPRPPRALEKGQPWKKQLAHFVCLSGIFAKMSFVQNYCFMFYFVDLSCPQNMFLFDMLGICLRE